MHRNGAGIARDFSRLDYRSLRASNIAANSCSTGQVEAGTEPGNRPGIPVLLPENKSNYRAGTVAETRVSAEISWSNFE